jgi:hypothetical protein
MILSAASLYKAPVSVGFAATIIAVAPEIETYPGQAWVIYMASLMVLLHD